MSIEERDTEELQLSELQRRVEELEDQLNQQQKIVARHEAQIRQVRKSTAGDEGRRRHGKAETPCAHCDDGILQKQGQKLVCSSCDYMSYL